MHKYGYEMLIEISKFWESRSVEKNGRLEILDIIGPDEYDEHIDNNTFTNYMAKYCVGQTLIELKKLKENDNNFYKKLSDKTKKIVKVANFFFSSSLTIEKKSNL